MIMNDVGGVQVNWDAIIVRLGMRDANGKLLPVITGGESDEELRDLAVQFTGRCPLLQQHFHCPFRLLSGISHTALATLLSRMKHQALLDLFDMECECRNLHESPAG
jgi:hypothetical protein